MCDAAVAIEKLRISLQNRKTHLAKHDRSDHETDELLTRAYSLEEYVDSRVAELIQTHPAYPWFNRVKGVGRENIGKVVSPIDIHKANTVSALWMFAGLAPNAEGHAMRRVKGEKLSYNSQLRSMCWRLATSLKRAKGKFYRYYLDEKAKYEERFTNEGKHIIPTPMGKWVCLNCGKSWEKKANIEFEPCDCETPDIQKVIREEPPGVIYKGHLDLMAMRKMIKLFLALLWLYWREAEGLPVTNPYPIDKLGHLKIILPGEMVDR